MRSNSERRHLVISPIGDDSVHRSWLSHPAERRFDLLLIYYGSQPGFGQDDCEHYLARRGFKWELLTQVVAELRPTLEQYDNIWLPDADIRADTRQVNRLFELFEEYKLQLAQPAIAAGEVSYQTLRQRAGAVLRYTHFVECMCPLFSRDAFFKVAPTFSESRSGWGLDLLWPSFFGPREMAIIDAVGVEHTGRLFRGENYQKLAAIGLDPGAEMKALLAKHGGFNRRLHNKFVRGRVKLPVVWEEGHQLGVVERLFERLGWRSPTA
jgi:hypothetical protein